MQNNHTESQGNWIPEILYEDSPDGLTGQFPFIPVPPKEIMPNMLFIFESRESGEFEPGLEGEEVPIFDLDLHQYVNLRLIERVLGTEALASIRTELNLPNRK